MKENVATFGTHWLVIAGPVSSYTYNLFHQVSRTFGVNIRVLHSPIEGDMQFQHERFEDGRFKTLRWRGASLHNLIRFISKPEPAAVFIYGTEARLPIIVAMG